MTWNNLCLVFILLFVGCNSQAPIVEEQGLDNVQSRSENRYTIANAILLSKEFDDRYANDPNHPCGQLPCNGSVAIKNIVSKGMDYHGQFLTGDTISAFFQFTLGNSASFFPQKNPVPNEIPLKSVIEITIVSERDGSYTVKDHKLIEND